MILHPRGILPLLAKRLAIWPVTVLTGARQTGKTTLVRDLLPASDSRQNVYLSLDDPDVRLSLAADPVRRLDHADRLVILDEIQKQPDLLDTVKLLVDRGQRHRFLLLGSSQILLLQKVRETLAGRSTLLELWPLALAERVEEAAVPSSGLDAIWTEGQAGLELLAGSSMSVDQARHWRGLAEEQFLWGGFPRIGRLDPEDRKVWLRDFRRTYLERDLADLGRVADLDQFALAQNLVAARTGQILSLSELSRDLGVAVNTVKRYLRFLEISYQVYLLRPLLPNVSTRMIKAPKLYWTDPGLARTLAGRLGQDDGAMFETAVLDEILRWASWQSDPPPLHFYRTAAGREVDLVLHSPRALLAVEVKASAKAHRNDAGSLIALLATLRLPELKGDAARLGLVITGGREVVNLAPLVWAIPAWRLFGPLV